MNDHLKAQQVMNDSMSNIRETFQTWLQQRQEQVVNLDTYTPEPSQYQKLPICYDDEDDEESSIPLRDIIISELPLCIAITPVLLTEEPVDSFIMEDKHLDTIPATESDEVIKSSIEDLVHTPSESDGISESECELPVCDDSSPKKDEVLDDIISIPSGNGNDHFNVESSLIESVLNRDNMISSSKIDFLLKEFTSELTLIALIPPGNCFQSDLIESEDDIHFIEQFFSFPYGTRNKIFDPGIFIEVQSEKFISQVEFSISFIRDPLFPVIDTLLPFLSKNEDKVVIYGILAADEEKSPHPSSHRGLRALNESPIMISVEDTPNLDVPYLHFIIPPL
ncbi:hypothetical protein Tco_1082912 [Tanacetum coccineum]|uniref:Uncharacterized protein n=1 Tax=Tanacetum coccineum TaxID=301880 RepID=A0ABQ5I1T1_9ASTR